MQLTESSIKSLQQLISVAQVAEIDNVIIEDAKIRGISDNKSVVLFAENNIPDFGFPRVGLNRLGTLLSRLALAKDSDSVVIESKQGKSDQDVGMLNLSWSGAKVQYRCADPASIRAPKNVRDVDTWAVTVPTEQIGVILNAMKSLKATKININTRTGSEVYFELVEAVSNDAFTLQVADGAEYLHDTEPKSKIWVNMYPASQLISILKLASDGKDSVRFIIGENGTLTVNINDTYKLIVVSIVD